MTYGAATEPPQAAAPDGVADRLVQGLLRRGYAAAHSSGSSVSNPNQAVRGAYVVDANFMTQAKRCAP